MNLKEGNPEDFQNPLLRRLSKLAKKDFFMSRKLIERFSEGTKPAMNLHFDQEFLTRLLSKNIPAYKERIKQELPLWAHVEKEDEKDEKYDSTNTLSDDDFENLEPVEDEKYLRPTRMCQVDAPEIRAKASEFRSETDSDKEFAEKVYDFVKNEKAMLFKPLNGALDTFKAMGGLCIDQLSLLIALSRAGGIPSRYKLHSLTYSEETQEAFVESDPIVSEVVDALGVLELAHGEAELNIGGDWISIDPTFSDGTEIGLDLPVTKFGEEPGWKERVPGGEIIMESIPFLFRESMLPFFTLLRGPIDNINSLLKKMRRFGKQRLEEIDNIERYNREQRGVPSAELPSMEEVKEFREG